MFLLPKDIVYLSYNLSTFFSLIMQLENIGAVFIVNPKTKQIAVSKNTLTTLSNGVM